MKIMPNQSHALQKHHTPLANNDAKKPDTHLAQAKQQESKTLEKKALEKAEQSASQNTLSANKSAQKIIDTYA